MKGFFNKLFGNGSSNTNQSPVIEVLDQLIEKAQLKLSYDVEEEGNKFFIDLYGEDEEVLLEKDAALLESIQLFLKRVAQNRSPEERFVIELDSCGYREKATQTLVELADKLKGIALERGKPVYVRALPPKDRKVIHQHFAEDGNVKSKSVGDGHFKKIKIFPLKA